MARIFVEVTYRGEPDERDDILGRLAKQKNGREIGSGYGFGASDARGPVRDILFDFPNEKKAVSFMKAVTAKKIKAKTMYLDVQ